MRAIIRAIDEALIVSLEGEADSLVASLAAESGTFATIEEQLRQTGASRLVVDFRDLVYIDGSGLQDLTDYLCSVARTRLVCFVGPSRALDRLGATLVRSLPAVFSESVEAACNCPTPSFDPKGRAWRQFFEQFEPGFLPGEQLEMRQEDDQDRGKEVTEHSDNEMVIDLDQEAIYLKAEPQEAVDPMSRPLEFRRGEGGSDTRVTPKVD